MTSVAMDGLREASRPRGADVVVVGGGVTGLSAAWWLAREGCDVLVLDKGVVGWEASGRNGGGCSHYQSPLFLEEQRLWPQMDGLLGYPTEHRPERIILAVTEGQWAQYRRIAAIVRAQGFRVDELDPAAAREAVPLAGDNAVGAIHIRTGGHANPQRTVQAYAWALQDLGGRILQHRPALGLVMRGGRVTGVETALGEIACDHLVVAAGPQAEGLLAPAGIRLPLAAARAEMIVTEPLPPTPPEPADLADVRRELEALLAMAGTVRHMRRELKTAAERGATMLDALDLPPLALDVLDATIARLDALDGDTDLEPWLAGDYNGSLPLDVEHEPEHDEDDGTAEPSLGAAERHPLVPWAGNHRRHYVTYSPQDTQAQWARGGRQDLECEITDEPHDGDGKDLEAEPAEDWIGSAVGNGDQTHWAQGEAGEREADPTDGVRLYKGPREWEETFARREGLRELTARARTIRSRIPAPGLDPDALMPVGPGVMAWGGPPLA